MYGSVDGQKPTFQGQINVIGTGSLFMRCLKYSRWRHSVAGAGKEFFGCYLILLLILIRHLFHRLVAISGQKLHDQLLHTVMR